MSNELKEIVINKYQTVFNDKPLYIVKAPGRINLIGEHTDYSNGFVLPAAINYGIMIAFSPRKDHLLKLYSVDFNEYFEFDVTDFSKGQQSWKEYIKGIAWTLQEENYPLIGWQGVIAGDIPIGAGLSSSAALEIASAKAFCVSGNFDITPTQLAQIAKKSEINWVGVNVGIMDHLISAAGKIDHAVLLDCKTMDHEYVPIPKEICFLVMDTKTRRELSNSAYNTRHEEVDQVSQMLGVEYLREATLPLLANKKNLLSSTLYRRARHVLTENQRVLNFTKAMRNTDINQMGSLINDSHASLRDDFEVSSYELNLIVSLAQSHPTCLGARMTGAGFGGCALALIKNANLLPFIDHVSNKYFNETGFKPNIFKIESAEGVQVIPVENS